MSTPENNPRIYLLSRSPLQQELAAFLIDREARGLSPRTLEYYQEKLGVFCDYLAAQGAGDVYAITARHLRSFLLDLARTHNPGGVHGHYRALKAFLRWWEQETEPDDWASPLKKVKAPKVPQEPLAPVDLDHLRAILRTCTRRTYLGDRDMALMLFLLDTGVRRAEMCALNVGDVNLRTGAVLVRHGKGGKSRVVFAGAKTRRVMMACLRHRPQFKDSEPLWATRNGTRLSPNGLREVLRRRARRAGVPTPSVHAFRRGFALLSLRAGVDLVSLQRLMGHSNLSVLARYLALERDDLRRAHEMAGPVDHML